MTAQLSPADELELGRYQPALHLLRRLVGRLGLVLLLVILFLLIIYPVGMIIYASLTDAPPRPGSDPANFTLEYYRLLAEPAVLRAIGNSMIIGIAATFGAVTMGGLLAWLAVRSDMPMRGLAYASGMVPLFVPSIVGALAYDLISAPHSGYLTILLRSIGMEGSIPMNNPLGISFVMAMFYAPYAYIFIASSFRMLNPEMEEAAAVHGARTWQVMARVTFPLSQPALLGATILSFILIIENFAVPMILGRSGSVDTIPTLLFAYMMGPVAKPNQAAALGMLLMFLTVLAVWWQSRLMRNREFHTISGKGFRPRRVALGRFRWVAVAFSAVYFALAVIIPVGVLLMAALRKNSFIRDFSGFFDPSQLTLDHVRAAFGSSMVHSAAINTFIVGISAAVLGVVLSFLLSYLVNRTKLKGRRVFEYIAMMPVAIPSLLIGMGFLWTWLTMPVKLYGTLLILILAYVARFMPQGYRGITSTIRQIHPDLEESARVSGASRVKSLWHVTAPLLRGGIVSTTILLFVLSSRELSTSIFLYTHDTSVLSIVIFGQWQSGQWPVMAVLSLTLALVLGLISLLGRGLGRNT